DLLLAVPPLFDSAGNALNMYDRVTWWDDFNHFVNPIFIAVALGLVLMRLPIGSWALAAFVTASSTTFGVSWELAEYLSFVKRSPEFNTAYEDTMGDLALDLAGSAVGAIIVVTAIRARRSLRQSGADSTGVEHRPI
ncbi:MAG: hypothetical protein IT336_09900, partial [Thermomicrobiales bacterium]|nr:hypothetical protein [Thermomicrobiales bacterium]